MGKVIYWTLHAMKKYWNCIKWCVEDICIYNPDCIEDYIEAYREMWEDEKELGNAL